MPVSFSFPIILPFTFCLPTFKDGMSYYVPSKLIIDTFAEIRFTLCMVIFGLNRPHTHARGVHKLSLFQANAPGQDIGWLVPHSYLVLHFIDTQYKNTPCGQSQSPQTVRDQFRAVHLAHSIPGHTQLVISRIIHDFSLSATHLGCYLLQIIHAFCSYSRASRELPAQSSTFALGRVSYM